MVRARIAERMGRVDIAVARGDMMRGVGAKRKRCRTGQDSSKAYFEWLRQWTEEDKKVVLLLIGFDLAVASLVLSEKLFSPERKSLLVAAAVLSLMVSAGCLFKYFHALHMALRALLPSILTGDTNLVDPVFFAVWQRNKTWFRLGYGLTAVGLGLLFIAYLKLVLSW